jgi:hypothetical protein
MMSQSQILQQIRRHCSTVMYHTILELADRGRSLVDMVQPCSFALSLEPEKTVYIDFRNDRKVLAHGIARRLGSCQFLNCGPVIVQGLAVWHPFVLWSRRAAFCAAAIFFVREGT